MKICEIKNFDVVTSVVIKRVDCVFSYLDKYMCEYKKSRSFFDF